VREGNFRGRGILISKLFYRTKFLFERLSENEIPFVSFQFVHASLENINHLDQKNILIILVKSINNNFKYFDQIKYFECFHKIYYFRIF